jgi:acyl carrier protein
MQDVIREVLARNQALASKVSQLGPEADLYEAGLASFDAVGLMLALEEAFDIEFPESMLNRRTFSSIGELERAVSTLVSRKALA